MEDESRPSVGAVVSNGDVCADFAAEIMRRGGSAVDAAISTLLCEGCVMAHSLGVGGGLIGIVYTRKTGKVEAMVARETAPGLAVRNMFDGKRVEGPLAAAVPGEIWGYWCLHQKYGVLPWKELFQQSIHICTNGIRVCAHLANALYLNEGSIRREQQLAEIFIDNRTNKVYKEGDIIYRKQLGETLRIIAEEGAEVMYRGGRIGKWLIEDLQEAGGVMTEADLQNFDVSWDDPVVTQCTNNYSLYTTPLPTGGVVLAFILNIVEPLYTKNRDVYWHRVVEAFKHAFGHRTRLGDVRFEPEVEEIFKKMLSREYAASIRKLIKDGSTSTDTSYYGAEYDFAVDNGTANMCVVATNGDAIIITSTINNHFGCKIRSRRTGIILNDEMDDFCTPGSTNNYSIPSSAPNFIKPGKRPMSSICPSMVFDREGNLRLLIGAAGGPRIITAVAQVILRYLILNESLKDAIVAGRMHHQLFPMHVEVEENVPKSTHKYLIKAGHTVITDDYPGTGKPYSVITAIGLKAEQPVPIADQRRIGSTSIVIPAITA